MKVFLARLSHESNGFAPGKTGLADFRTRFGADIFSLRGDGSCMGAFLGHADSHGWEVVPSFDLAAGAGPVATDEVVATALRHLENDLPAALRRGLDGIYLLLHGAMVSESCDDVEGLLLGEIRRHLAGRKVPVAAMLDMHANVSPAMAAGADILVAFRENPHTDAVETALRTARLLGRAMDEGTRFRTLLFQAPILWPPTGTGTADEPMKGLARIALESECEEIPSISVCPGFAQSDTPHTGLSFQMVAIDDPSSLPTANRIAARLWDHASRNASLGLPREWPLLEAIDSAIAGGKFPALIVEPADNIGGGAPGDATWVLKAFLKCQVKGSGLILAAPTAVEQLRDVPPGATERIVLGGQHPGLCGPAVTLQATVKRHSDGEFDLEDPQSHLAAARGTRIRMGRSVLVECEGLLILLTTLPTAPMDLGQWRCVGVDPQNFRLIAIKAAVAHRRAYDPIAASSYTASTPGPCSSDVVSFPYRKLRRPMFPFDPIPDQALQPIP